jgi:hypothetical protein
VAPYPAELAGVDEPTTNVDTLNIPGEIPGVTGGTPGVDAPGATT